jgi:hypothetical protein
VSGRLAAFLVLGCVVAAAVAAVSLAAVVPGPGGYWDYHPILNGPQCKPHERDTSAVADWAKPRRMTILTDSVLLGSVPTLREAKPCWRVFGIGRPALAADGAVRELGKRRVAPVVVIGLGMNSSWERGRGHYARYAKYFDRTAGHLLETLRSRGAKQFVWLTVRVPNKRIVPRSAWGDIPREFYLRYVNERLGRLDRQRDDLVLCDWNKVSQHNGLTFDTVHVWRKGAKLMVRTIRKTILDEAQRQGAVKPTQ